MNSIRYSIYCRPSRRRDGRRAAMTLIEVLVGMALLGSLVAAISLAKARSTRQLAQSRRQLAAVAATDQLLTQWWRTTGGGLAVGDGQLPGDDGFSWRIVSVDKPALENLPVRPVRLEVIDQKNKDNTTPMFMLELLLPVPSEDANGE